MTHPDAPDPETARHVIRIFNWIYVSVSTLAERLCRRMKGA